MGSVFVEHGLDTDAADVGFRRGESTETRGIQHSRRDHVHGHPPGPVGVRKLADEVGQSSVGHTGIACLRRGFRAEQAADRDDPGPINESDRKSVV